MDDRFSIQHLPLAGLTLMQRKMIGDNRGFLQRLYCKDVLSALQISEPIAQINHTVTRSAGSIRGMHFQYAPAAETKIISCMRGKVFDVAIDLRQNSPTFLQWHAEILSPELGNSYVIPKGFAHGFQTLTDDCELLYFHTASYNAEVEGGLSPLDPRLAIAWPVPITEMSNRDRQHPYLKDCFKGLKDAV